MTAVLEVNSVVKNFGKFRALDDFSLSVSPRSIHGFLGPNGAGKSTTIRTLLGLLHPNSGFVRVLGRDPRKHPRVLKKVGYVPGEVALWPALTGEETFRALESLRGVPSDRRREKELIEAFSLDPSKKTRDYSTGNRRKVSLIAALSFGAEVLILDEPTAGLDPLMEAVFVEEIRREHADGISVLLSSHIMSEVEKLCQEVTVIKAGQVVEQGSVQTLRHLSAHSVSAVVDGKRVSHNVERNEVPNTLRRLLDAGATDITTQPASLEEIFLSHYDTKAGTE